MGMKTFECTVCQKQLRIPDSTPEEVKRQREAAGFFMVEDNILFMVCSEFCSEQLKEQFGEEDV